MNILSSSRAPTLVLAKQPKDKGVAPSCTALQHHRHQAEGALTRTPPPPPTHKYGLHTISQTGFLTTCNRRTPSTDIEPGWAHHGIK
jgi:hypothetical protein